MSWSSRTWRGVWRAASGLWWTVTVVAGAACLVAGSVLLGTGALLLMCVVVAACTAMGVHHACETTGLRRPRVAHVSAAAAAGAVALCGSGALLSAAGPLLLAVLAAAGWALRRWRRAMVLAAVRDAAAAKGRHPARGSTVVRRSPAAPDGDVTRLCRTWRASYDELARCTDPARRAALVARREECLAQIEQRAPEGFRRWMDTVPGPQDDPLRFLVRAEGGGTR